MTGKFLLIYIWNFHVLNHLLLIYICKLHWNRNKGGRTICHHCGLCQPCIDKSATPNCSNDILKKKREKIASRPKPQSPPRGSRRQEEERLAPSRLRSHVGSWSACGGNPRWIPGLLLPRNCHNLTRIFTPGINSVYFYPGTVTT